MDMNAVMQSVIASGPEIIWETSMMRKPWSGPGTGHLASGRPPLLVKSHGGPTGATAPVFDPRIQFWTSRGFALLDVNYRGSTGFGRAYRNRLRGQWGVFDVDDCEAAARFAV